MNTTPLLSSYELGHYTLSNRIVMAPMTRNRAGEGKVPQAMNAEHYAQRASAGLIITEGSQVSPQGFGYPSTPGIHSPQQVKGWQRVTKAVHDRDGRIFPAALARGADFTPLVAGRGRVAGGAVRHPTQGTSGNA